MYVCVKHLESRLLFKVMHFATNWQIACDFTSLYRQGLQRPALPLITSYNAGSHIAVKQQLTREWKKYWNTEKTLVGTDTRRPFDKG